MSDVGLTHVAFLVADLEASIAFYAKYARMEVVHRRRDGRSEVAWVSDKTRPFVVVLVRVPAIVPRVLLRLVVKVVFPFEHLGVACATREDDPDGHTLELSYGQEVGLTVERVESP